jgi:predicted transcriptional regulator
MNIFRKIRNDVVYQNESWDIFIAQKRGAGKSAIATRLAMMLDPNFSMDHVCFTVSKFVHLLTSRLQPGTVLVFDDLGTQKGGSSRKWQKKESQDLADIMQLNRTDGIITIATSLELERGEKRMRAGFALMADPGKKLSNADTGGHGLASRIILRKKITDVFDGTTHWQYWRYAAGGRIVAIDVSHPPSDFWMGEYKAERDKFLHDIKEDRKDEIESEITPKGTRIMHAAIAKEMGIHPKKFPVHLEALGWLHTNGAINQATGVSVQELNNAAADIFNVTPRTAQKYTAYWKTFGCADSKRSQRGSVWWITEKGIKLVAREPIS